MKKHNKNYGGVGRLGSEISHKALARGKLQGSQSLANTFGDRRILL